MYIYIKEANLFTRCSLLVVKLLVSRCGNYLLQKIICCNVHSWLAAKGLVTLAKDASDSLEKLLTAKKLLVTRYKILSLLVLEVPRCKNSLMTHCRSCLLQISFVTYCEIRSLLIANLPVNCYSLHRLLVAKNYSSLIMKFTRGKCCLFKFNKPRRKKLNLFNIICFLKQ